MLLVKGQPNSSELTLHRNLQGFSLKPTLCIDASRPLWASGSSLCAGAVCGFHLSRCYLDLREELSFTAGMVARAAFCSICSPAKARSRIASVTKSVYTMSAD